MIEATIIDCANNKVQAELCWGIWTAYTKPHADEEKTRRDAERLAKRIGQKIEWTDDEFDNDASRSD